MSLSPLRCLCSSTPKLSITSFRYDCNCLPSYSWNLFPLLSFFFIFEKHSAAEVVHQAFTAQFSYIPRVGLTRCNAFPFGQLFKREVLRKCGEQRRTSNNEKCHFDLNQKHKPHLSRSTISYDFSDGLSPVSPCMLSAANQENLLKMQNMVRTNPPEWEK